jgi:hypothetical protein
MAMGELEEAGAGARFALRLHLAYCRHCRRFLRELRALAAAARAWAAGLLSAEQAAGCESRLLKKLLQ